MGNIGQALTNMAFQARASLQLPSVKGTWQVIETALLVGATMHRDMQVDEPHVGLLD